MERMISQNRVEVIPSDFIMKMREVKLVRYQRLRKTLWNEPPRLQRQRAHAEAVVGEERQVKAVCAHFASTSELSDDPTRCAGVSRNARCACTL